MKIKLLNLNIWNYNKWEERKPKIVSFIKKERPDIITLQEVRDDIQFNKKGDNQAKQLKRELDYFYYAFSPITDKRKERSEQYKRFCIEGMAVLSKYQIVYSKGVKLKKHPNDRYTCGFLHVKLKIDNKKIDLLNVHFSNNEYFSLLHIFETLKYIKKRRISPVIVGDFNFYEYEILNDLVEKNFLSSMKYKKYISYPLNKWTLDYILIPKNYKFKSLKCTGRGLSDHMTIISDIEEK
ncbi:endonuclease/exonuclease/phosphatase family protein [Candidatus Pacearchaeota archaeon]|nr:endonuclease/exonuclease/phosphatase family protein [Candidatus Pacearchaeota archaeon]